MTRQVLRLLLKAHSSSSVPHVRILVRIFLKIGRMHHWSYSMLLISCLSCPTLTRVASDFSIRSSLPSMQTSNSRARIEGSKIFNSIPVGAAMSRARDTRNMSQIMLMNPRCVGFFDAQIAFSFMRTLYRSTHAHLITT